MDACTVSTEEYIMKKVAATALAFTAVLGGTILTASPANAQIILYEHDNYGGAKYYANGGWNAKLPGFNDVTSSLKVDGGNYAILYENVDYRGAKSVAFSSGSPSLKTWQCSSGGNWNDKASSVE